MRVSELQVAGSNVGRLQVTGGAYHICLQVEARNSSMDMELFSTYQRESRKTWGVIDVNHPIVYPTLGLVNEAGEVAGKIKKIFRDKGGAIGDADREALKYELGDVLWYLTQICTELGLTLEDVAAANIEKLFSRLERGQIRGEGDAR